jgi:hypothetical protein
MVLSNFTTRPSMKQDNIMEGTIAQDTDFTIKYSAPSLMWSLTH